MSNLIEKWFAVETPKGNFQAKYVSTNWAKGFNCTPRSCGLCCITELPEGVPKKSFKPFDKLICGHFNIERKTCQAYDNRPWGCRTYPFIFGVESGQVIISPSLECPSTNISEINLDILEKTFRYPAVGGVVDSFNDIFEKAKRSRFWDSSEEFWVFLQDEINKYLDSNTHFPMLNDLSELVHGCIDHYFNVHVKRPEYPPINKIISTIVEDKSFISTNFHTNHVYFVKMNKLRAHLTIWNPSTGEIKTIETQLTMQPQELEIKKDGMQLLKDYFSLLFKRPFLSLAALTWPLIGIPTIIPTVLVNIFAGNFVYLEAVANLFAYRLRENGIDRNSMRELLSFADGCLVGQFRNPDKSIRSI